MKNLMYNPYYSLIEFGFFIVVGTAAGNGRNDMKNYIPLKIVPFIFYWALTFAILFERTTTAYAETLWVQVPQWSDDWEKCAVDVPDASVIGTLLTLTNTFGEGFDQISTLV